MFVGSSRIVVDRYYLTVTNIEPRSTIWLSSRFSCFLDLIGAAAGFLDLVLCCLGETMGGDLQRFRDVAVSKNDKVMLCFLDQSSLVKQFRCDLITGIKTGLDLSQADLDPLLLEDIGESALWQAALQRHLAAFETGAARIS